MAVTEAQSTNAGRRRLAYGANAAVQIVLIVAAVIGAVYLAQLFRGQVDVTRSGVNSLSPRTLALLKGLDKDVRVTAIYTVLSEYDERAQKRQDAVRDMLRLYEAAGRGRVTADVIDPMKDRAKLPAMLQRLRELPAYKDEAKAHLEILEAFPALSQKIVQLAEKQAAEAESLSGGNAKSIVMEIASSLRKLVQQSQDTAARLKEFQAEELPRYGAMVDAVKALLDGVTRYFDSVKDWVERRAPQEKDVTPDVLNFLQIATGDYVILGKEISALTQKATELKPLKLEELSGELNRWATSPPILVETKQKAEVISFWDAWPQRQQGMTGPDGDDREFAGERGISSAILKLTDDKKTGIVFVRYGGQSPITPDFSRAQFGQFPQAPFGSVNEALTKANFVTTDWDVQTTKEPPKVEGAAQTIYVVMPPAPPPPRDPMRPQPPQGMTPADIKLVTDAVDATGMAVFMAGWTPPSSPIPDMEMGSKYEYGEYLRTKWGIEVESKYLVAPFAPSTETPGLFVPTRNTGAALLSTPELRMSDHPVTKPLQTSQLAMDRTCPLNIVATGTQPAGVKVEPLVELGATDDIWGLSNIQRVQEDLRTKRGTTRRDDDRKPPFTLAVAAERSAAATTQPTTAPGAPQRVVVFASSNFASNSLIEAMALDPSTFSLYALFPGNLDLVLNTIHWLTNDAGRISVGAQHGEVPRLDKLKDDGWYFFWKIFLVGIWPASALVVGAGVWMLRRQ